MNRNLLPQISSLFTSFITKSYTLVLTLVLVLNFGITSKVNAQCIGPYQGFESGKVKGQAAGGFVALTGSTAVASIKTDDAISGAIPIGFTFTYNGNNYTNVYASSNGFLSFNPAATSSPTNNLTSPGSSQLPLLAPLWDDLDGTTPTAVASYLTTGVAGSRIFTFEWLNWEWGAAANTPVISFQVKLYEANGRVEFIYRPDAGAVNTTSGGASVGVTGNIAGDFLSLANLSTTVVSSKVVETSNITAKPLGNITFGLVGTMVGDGWGFTANATPVANAANARNGIYFVQLPSTGQSITTPLLTNPDKFQFYYRSSSAVNVVNFIVEWSTDNTFATVISSANFSATTNTYTSTGLINLSALSNVYVRIRYDTFTPASAALWLDDFSWTSRTATENTIIVPETGNTICGDNSPTLPINVPDAASGRSLTFYDQGGSSDVYNRLQSQTLYFAPTTIGDKVQLTLSSLGLDNILTGAPTRSTTVTIYSGTTLTAPNIIATLTSATVASGQTYTSIAANGYITVVIAIYDGSTAFSTANTTTGFQFNVKCVATPTITSLSSSAGCLGSTMTISGTNLSGATSVSIGGTPVSSIGVNTSASLIVTPAVGSSGTVTVVNPGGTVTSLGTYTVNAIPTISSPPSSGTETLCVGGSATPLSVTAAAGSGTITTYQWYSNTSASTTGATLVATNSSAATTDTYTPSTASVGTLYYYVVVTNSNTCSVTSTFTGAITVNAPVSITASPSTAAQTVCVGSAITPLSVTATGGGLGYQWYSNNTNSNVGGTLISGATAVSYTPSNAAAMAITYYYCVVSNGAPCNSSVTSNVSGGITVNALPAAVTVSASGTYCTNTTLTATNGGSGTMYFQSTTSGGTFIFAPTASQVISLSGTYYFRARSAAGCWGPEGSATVTILSVPVAPTANADPSPTTNSFTASWNSVSGATGYFLDVATDTGFTSLVSGYSNLSVGNVTTFSVTGLNPNATYYYRVRAFNGTCSGSSSGAVTVTTLGLSYCSPSGATFPQDPSGITNFTMGSINNTTVIETNNYGDYTSISTNVFIGATIPFSITLRTGFTYDTNIWIDWNNDGDFNDAGELVYSGTSASSIPTTLTGTIAVPLLNSNSTSTLGSHRLRIGSIDGPGFTGGALTPCRNGAYQAFEDYTVIVIPVPACAVTTPSSLTTASVTGTSATLVWSDPAMTPNTIYNYWVSTTNVAPPADGSNPAGMGTVTGALTANITGLTLGVTYYFWVRVKCDATNFSAWIGSANFTTANLDVITMTNGSITSCNARFYDSGGFGSTYQNNEVFTYTFTPSAGNSLKVVFNSFDTENNYDGLMIYNGPSTASPLIPSGLPAGTNAATAPADSYYGTNSPGTITTPVNGSITFQFRSDGSVLRDGWDATITCVTVPTITSFTPNNACAGATPTVTLTGTNLTGATSVKFNGVDAVFTPVNSTTITATLPSGATTGFITVANANATGTSSQTFVVKPIPNTPNAGSDVVICSGQSTNLNATYTPATNSLLTTLVGGNGCTNGNMFNITTGTNPITLTSFDIIPNATGVQNVSVYYRVGTYVGNETIPGAWTLLGTYVVNGVDKTLINMPVASLSIPASSTYGIYINYNAAYSNGTNTYSNSDITINTGAGLCAAFGSVTASRTFNGRVYYQLNLPLTYSWTPATGLNFTTIFNPQASPTSTQTYTVTATSNGCTSAGDSVVVTVNSVPTTTITNPSGNVCANSVIAVNVTGSASTYTWTSSVANTLYSNSTGSTLYVPGTNIAIIYVKTSSTATITATGSNALGCSSTSTVTFTVSTKTFSGGLWTPGGPPLNNGTENLVFASGTYNLLTGTGLSACSCTVSGATVTFNAGQSLSLVNGLTVTSGSITFNNGASLLQTNNVANSGNIAYKRNVSGLFGYDYVYWSSPVLSQDISNFYSTPTPGFKYYWDTLVNNGNGNGGNTSQGVWSTASGAMQPGKGYIVRASSSFGWTGNLTATFTGVPNNGIITVPVNRGSFDGASGYNGLNGSLVTRDDDNYNLIGNPYPSAIDAVDFLTDSQNASKIKGFVYLWTHGQAPNSSTNPFYGSYTSNYNANDYLTYNSSGPSIQNGFAGKIASGQGFFVVMQDGAEVTGNTEQVVFKNTMRNADNSQFYRTSSVTPITEEKNRIWLDLVDANSNACSTLVAYVQNATNGVDRMYDAITKVKIHNLIYSTIENQKYIIQGRSLPFDGNDLVPIGYNAINSGIYKIAIAAVDGLFNNGQSIYLEDKLLNVIHDLRSAPYSFGTESGIFEDRFVLRYTAGALGVPVFAENTVVVYKNETGLSINSGSIPMKSVAIYDVTGRLITSQKEIYATQTRFTTLPSTNQVLLVEITSETGVKVTKKVVY